MIRGGTVDSPLVERTFAAMEDEERHIERELSNEASLFLTLEDNGWQATSMEYMPVPISTATGLYLETVEHKREAWRNERFPTPDDAVKFFERLLADGKLLKTAPKSSR